MKKNSTLIFIGLALGITWLWIPALILMAEKGYALPTIDTLMQQGGFSLVNNGLPSLLGQTASLVGMSYIYAWLLNGSRSLWIPILFQGLSNTNNAAANATVIATPIVNLAIAATPWLVAVLLERSSKQSRRRLEHVMYRL